MQQPTLYLFIGYPGAGKTTVAKFIAAHSHAYHIWADQERLKLFKHPTHSHAESLELYQQLNAAVDYLLGQGRDVIFDTNFNFLSDREHLRAIADRRQARTVVIWVNTPKALAKQRAVDDNNMRNGYPARMTAKQFEHIAAKLEIPGKSEKVIKIDGTKLDVSDVMRQLGLHEDD